MTEFKDNYKLILKEIDSALNSVEQKPVDQFTELLINAEKVFVVGVGRVMLSLQAFAKRLNHIGVKTWFVGEINEPAITENDLLIVGSGSGESVFPVAIAKIAKKHHAKIVHIGSTPKSSLAPVTDLMLRIPVKTNLALPGEINSKQVMSSLFEQSLYILADAVVLQIVKSQKIDIKALWKNHANLE